MAGGPPGGLRGDEAHLGVIGHSSVLMVLSLSLIGTSLTIGYLHMAGWLQSAVRLGTSLAAVCCGSVALWRLIPALWRALRAVIRTRRRRWDSESTWTTSVEETGRTAGSDAYGAGGPTTPDASAEQPAPPHPPCRGESSEVPLTTVLELAQEEFTRSRPI